MKKLTWVVSALALSVMLSPLVCMAEDIYDVYNKISQAADEGDMQKADQLIANIADLNAKDAHGFTPLTWAAYFNHIEMAKLLIEKGADINAKAATGMTPLACTSSWAVNDSTEMAKLLIEKGADVNARNNMGWSILISTAHGCRAALVKLLIENGADVNAQTPDGDTALSLVEDMNYSNYNDKINSEKIIQMLREAGAN